MKNTREAALNYALYLLSGSARTRQEIIDKLRGKGIDEMIVRDVLKSLEANGWVDDLAYATYYIESRQNRYGKYRLINGLKMKGVEAACIEAAFLSLEASEEFETPQKIAKKLLDRKIEGIAIDWQRLEGDYAYKGKIYQKLARFLASRGFASDVVKTVVGERLSQEFFDES